MKTQHKPSPTSPKQSFSAATSPLQAALNLWNADSRAQGFSEQYLYTRTSNLGNFLWWLTNGDGAPLAHESITSATVRGCLGYLRQPSEEARFGSSHHNARKALRPANLSRYFRDIRTFVNFLLAEGLLAENPLQNIKAPKVPKDQVVPLTEPEITALLDACHPTPAPERNRAIVLLLLDTGLSLSELASLCLGDLQGNCVEVLGKGNKRRTVYFGKTTRRSLNAYITRIRGKATPREAVFVSNGGITAGQGLTPTGVYQVIRELAISPNATT